MRRAILALTFGSLLFAGAAACGDNADAPTAAASATSATSDVVSAAPSSPAADYTADTKQVCGKVEKVLTDDIKGFATELGKMIAYKEAKQTSDAATAREAAGKELKGVAATIKKTTAAAQDPKLQAAGAESAAAIVKTADDDKFFGQIKSTTNMEKIVEAKFTEWFVPLGEFCA